MAKIANFAKIVNRAALSPNLPFLSSCAFLDISGRLWQNCHFRHICQIRRFRQLLWGPYIALCFASLAIVAKLSFSPYLPNSPLSPTFMGPLHCFVLCLVGDCGKIVIFAIFAKFANIISFLQFLLLCAFLDISQFLRKHSLSYLIKLIVEDNKVRPKSPDLLHQYIDLAKPRIKA